MFDDIKKSTTPQQDAGQVPQPSPGQAPAGPAKDQADISSTGTSPEPVAAPASQPVKPEPLSKDKPTEDIFADTDKIKEGQPAKPTVFQPKAQAPSEPAIVEEKKPLGLPNKLARDSKKYFVLAAIILGLLLVSFVGWYSYNKFFASPVEEQAQEQNQTEEQASQEEEQAAEPAKQTETEIETPTAPPADSDQDGVTDEEEEALGLDINSVDSDGDGLFDREEIKVYKTDPLAQDTDGDGYSDGDEVKNGYNPKGPGMLYEIE